jgi:hypothetical protein
LSFDGALIAQATSPLPLGAKVTVTLRPEEESISIRGKVVYVQTERLFGVEFSGSDENILERLMPIFQNHTHSVAE